MSDVSTVRTSVRDWFASKVRIDYWNLDEPDSLYSPASTAELPLPPSSAIELPVKDLQYERTGDREITGSGIFTYQLCYRYSGQLTFHELPTNRCELLQQYLAGSCLLELGGCGGIQSAEPDTEEYPVQVGRGEGEQGDWYIRVTLVLLIRFSVDELLVPPEFGPVDALPDDLSELNNLNIRVFKSHIRNLSDSTLDAELNIPKP